MAQATVELEEETPEATRVILARVPGLAILPGRPANTLVVNRKRVSLALISGGLRPYASATSQMLAGLAGAKGQLGLVVADRLPDHVRRELVAAGCAYADGTGATHIDVPGFFVHQDGAPSRRQTLAPAPRGIGVTGVRTIQCLLERPERDWSVADLATTAACSVGEAHRVFLRLQDEGFVTTRGQKKTLRRRVGNPGDLLDWLSTVPSARRIRERLCATLYVANPDALTTTLAYHGVQSGLEYAFTGAAAARIYGVTATSAIPVTMLRIAPDVPLDDACRKLGAEPAERGANIVLIRDDGRVGVHGRMNNGPCPLAVRARVWLDMLDEQRGEDAAALFREGAIGW